MRKAYSLLAAGALAFLAGCGETAMQPGGQAAGGTEATAHGPGDGHNHGPGDGHDHGAPGDTHAGEKPAGESGVAPGSKPKAYVAPPNAGQPGGPSKVDPKALKTTLMGLKYAVLKEGKGAASKEGQTVRVHYTGWLESNGEKFDSSLDRSDPFVFSLGAGQVIKGWDEGVAGMKVGEKRQLLVPSTLGYGEMGTPGGPIPPNANLIFDVELLGIE